MKIIENLPVNNIVVGHENINKSPFNIKFKKNGKANFY